MTGVEASTLPLPNHVFGVNGLCLIEDSGEFYLFDVLILLGKFFESLLEAVSTKIDLVLFQKVAGKRCRYNFRNELT